jgi:hypothetical protein
MGFNLAFKGLNFVNVRLKIEAHIMNFAFWQVFWVAETRFYRGVIKFLL